MYITALDFGSSQIKILVAELGKDNKLSLLEVLKFPSAGMRKGEVVDVQEATQALSGPFSEIRKINKGVLKNIFVNIGGKNVKIQNSKGFVAVSRADNEIYQDDIERAIKASQAVNLPSNRKVFHTIIQEYVVDGVDQIKNPLGMNGTRLEVNSLIVDAFSPTMNDLVKSVEIAGGKITEFIYAPLAASNAALTKTHKELGAVLIDIGFGTTGFAVFEENKLITAKVFPIGSSNITNDLAIALKSSIGTAEKLKISYGHAFSKDVSSKEKINLQEIDESLKSIVSRKYISEIIEARLAEIFELIHNELKLLGKTQLPAGAVLCGAGAKLEGIVDLAKHDLKLPAHLVNYELDLFGSSSEGQTLKVDDPEFALALGLLNYGSGQFSENTASKGFISKIFSNLMP